jgi:hypothetical protein
LNQSKFLQNKSTWQDKPKWKIHTIPSSSPSILTSIEECIVYRTSLLCNICYVFSKTIFHRNYFISKRESVVLSCHKRFSETMSSSSHLTGKLRSLTMKEYSSDAEKVAQQRTVFDHPGLNVSLYAYIYLHCVVSYKVW